MEEKYSHMSNKNILCCGDSWTAGSNPRDENGIPLWTKPSTRDGPMVCDFFPLWPEVLAEKLNMGYINLGCGGRVTRQKTQAASNLCCQNIGTEEMITSLGGCAPGPSDKSCQVTISRSIFCEQYYVWSISE